MKKLTAFLLALALLLSATACSTAPESSEQESESSMLSENESLAVSEAEVSEAEIVSAAEEASIDENSIPEDFVFTEGGSFEMGSPDSEPWRSADETQHKVSVSDFYISAYEVTQKEYTDLMGTNPSTFSGDNLPVENMTWYEAVEFCNARSEAEGLTPAYIIDGQTVTWDQSADGYRLPTEAEWEYACRAGTTTPFNTENSPSADEVNYYGHYPYEIEGNYFSQDELTTRPGTYRETTVDVGSFAPNKWGLYDMHGNVSEWCFDIYGPYDTSASSDPTGAASGNLRVTRGGGWNDFAKNMRSAYRATTAADLSSYNLGIRLVRGIVGSGQVVDSESRQNTQSSSNILIAYFSWGGNTRGIAEQIAEKTGAELFEIQLTNPYSSDYNTVLDEAQRDQNTTGFPAARLEEMQTAFVDFKKEALQRKKTVKEKTASPKEFTDWLYQQSNIILLFSKV